MASIERDPLFDNEKYYDLTKDELRELTVQRVASLSSHINSVGALHKRFALTGLADPGTGTRTGVHFGLFLSSVRGSGTLNSLLIGSTTVPSLSSAFSVVLL